MLILVLINGKRFKNKFDLNCKRFKIIQLLLFSDNININMLGHVLFKSGW